MIVGIAIGIMVFLAGMMIGRGAEEKRCNERKHCREVIQWPDGDIILEQGDKVWFPESKTEEDKINK